QRAGGIRDVNVRNPAALQLSRNAIAQGRAWLFGPLPGCICRHCLLLKHWTGLALCKLTGDDAIRRRLVWQPYRWRWRWLMKERQLLALDRVDYVPSEQVFIAHGLPIL